MAVVKHSWIRLPKTVTPTDYIGDDDTCDPIAYKRVYDWNR